MTITIVRPTSTDRTNGTVTVVGSGGANGVTDDAPSDTATYITSSQWGASVWLGLGDLTLTGTQLVKQVKGQILCFHNSADIGHVDLVDFRLRDSVTNKTTPAVTLGTGSNTAETKETGWIQKGPSGVAWTETVFDRLEADIAWRARDTTANGNPQITQLRVAEVYVLADVHEQLSITAVTATGFNASTRPGFSFTLATDPDGDLQTKRRIRVFSSTVYSAGGFNPETSTKATWDSGILPGSTTSGTVGVDLVNGITYRVYVSVAKDWVPAGALWWSAWANSTAFTVNTTPPIVPTLVLTSLPDLPWYRNLVEATAPVNLLSADEASFDFASVGTWAVDANAAAPTVSATNPKSGVGSMTMSSSAAGAMRMVVANKLARPGITYTVGASFRAAVSARSDRVLIRFKRGATLLSTITGGSVTDTTTGYTSATASGTAPAGTDNIDLVAEVLATGAAAEVHRVDEVFLHAGTTTAYTPGGLSTTQTVPVERGERVSMGRGPGSNWAHPQVWSGGTEQRQAINGFAALSASDTIAWEPIDVTLDGPAGMIHWAVRSGASVAIRVGDAVDALNAPDYWFPVAPSQTHTFSLRAWADATFSTRLNIDWMDSAGGAISTTNGPGVSFTTTPTQWTLSAAAPSNAVFARGSVSNLGSSAVSEVFLTRIGWGLGSVAVDDQPPMGGPLVWSTVRDLTEFGDPVQPGEQVQLIDAEAPAGRPVVYRARTLATYGTDTIASDYSAYLPAYLAPPTRPLLKDPWQPERATIVNVWPGDDVAQSEDATELHGMGRDGDPVFLRSWHGRTRALELSALSHADYDRLTKLLDSSRPLLWQWTEGGAEYLRVTGWTVTRTMPGYYKSVKVAGALTARPS